MDTISKAPVTAAGSSFLTGLSVLLYALVDKAHMTPSDFTTAVVSGGAIVLGTVVAFLAHHLGSKKVTAAQVSAEIVQDFPAIKQAYTDLQPVLAGIPALAALARDAKAAVDALSAAQPVTVQQDTHA